MHNMISENLIYLYLLLYHILLSYLYHMFFHFCYFYIIFNYLIYTICFFTLVIFISYSIILSIPYVFFYFCYFMLNISWHFTNTLVDYLENVCAQSYSSIPKVAPIFLCSRLVGIEYSYTFTMSRLASVAKDLPFWHSGITFSHTPWV